MKKISIITPCYNEEGNIEELCTRIRAVMATLPQYSYEHLFIDNHSTDGTVGKIKSLAAVDRRIKLIVNSRNFGHVRSGYYALLQVHGDAVIIVSSDLQDPPEVFPEFLKKWEEGFKIVMAVKPTSEESLIMSTIRKSFYGIIDRISDVPLVPNATGAGLYDQSVVKILREIDDPYPYFRGLLCEIGYPIATIAFAQPRRKRGITKNNFYTLFELAMLGVVKHSKVPLRLMTFMGFSISLLSIFVMFIYLGLKLVYWESFSMGLAPVLIGLFFFGSVQLFFMGILGEYIGSIHTHVRKLPLVVELERVNFEQESQK